MTRRLTQSDKGFAQGFAVACSMLFQIYGDADLAKQLLRGSLISLSDFEMSDLDPSDLEIVRDLLGAPAPVGTGRE
jgi:hypothetical protein